MGHCHSFLEELHTRLPESLSQCFPLSSASSKAAPLINLSRANRLSGNPMRTSSRYHCPPSLGKIARTLQDDYEIDGKVLGVGLCGNVVVAMGKADQRCFALKTINKSRVRGIKMDQLIAEVEIYLSLDHPNIARLHDVYETASDISLLTECCGGGELYFALQKRGVYTDANAAAAAQQMLQAIGYLHGHGVVHRDIKLENFLYENESEVAQLKLIDFGFAKIWDPSTLMMASCGSIAYVSPDVITGKGYTNKCDMWSLGVVVWMLLVGYPPFHGNERQMLVGIKAGQPDWRHKARWKHVSDDAVDFLKTLLEADPARRISAQQALSHTWLARGSEEKVSLSRDCLRSMAHYANASKARRAVLQLLAQELAPEETKDLRDTFLAIDKQKHGTISLQDLKDAIRTGGPRSPDRRSKRQAAAALSPSNIGRMMAYDDQLDPVSPGQRLRRSPSCELEELFSHLAMSGDEELYYSDFLAATMEARSQLREEAVQATFRRLDADDSGSISVTDFKAVLGATFEGIDVEEIMVDVTCNGSDEISFKDFVRVLEDRDEVPQATPQEFVDPLVDSSLQTLVAPRQSPCIVLDEYPVSGFNKVRMSGFCKAAAD